MSLLVSIDETLGAFCFALYGTSITEWILSYYWIQLVLTMHDIAEILLIWR
jgi:hypothetical protein